MSDLGPANIPKFGANGFEFLSAVGAGALSFTYIKAAEINPIFHADTNKADNNRVAEVNGHISNLQTTEHLLDHAGPVPSHIYRVLDAKIAQDEAQVQHIRAHTPAFGPAQQAEALLLGGTTILACAAIAAAGSYGIRKVLYWRRMFELAKA